MAMAHVKFTKPPDLSGRTPIYRLSKTVAPPPQPTPPQPSPQLVHHTNNANYLAPYHPYPPGFQPYIPPQTPSQPSSQPPPQPPSQPHSTPQDNKENGVAKAQTPQSHNSPAQGSPMTKRRGRKLQESETLILVNCCLEYQSLYHDNPQRFWYCVATSLKRQIKRNFSWQSCRQIVEELVAERRERRRDVAAGKKKEQPMTELVLATDKWISFTDAPPGGTIASPAQPLKRPGPEPTNDSNAKRPKPQEAAHTSQPVSQPATQQQPQPISFPTYPPQPSAIPTIPSGPTMAEFQTLKVDIRSLRMDVQAARRELIEVRREMNSKLDTILQTLQEVKAQNEAKESDTES
ncbi:uncharacterized protein DSM5745_03607 [Aspergillus mulundensis]|uniref:Uncharacterized protein n=1 Tax=Aspergillus mulundensis TaxID=1810919 RepID=A0A3D8SKU9_9EURO|nr:Uncharacterized protein DSM5745_03607 [Aspergillus mulundensis]RDW86965.1 Uncharacterized protein DSM5745_03607 [Aspergillus mulundensis]